MKLQVIEKTLYKKSLKKLSKHYKNIEKDVDNFLNSIKSKDNLGIELKSNVFKARIKNSDKNRGKSAGYRLISYSSRPKAPALGCILKFNFTTTSQYPTNL